MSVFQCPACSSSFRVSSKHAGRKVNCPSCQQVVSIPKTESNRPSNSTTKNQVYQCPECNGKFGVDESMTNSKVACPHCNAHVRVDTKNGDSDGFPPGHSKSDPNPNTPEIQTKEKKKHSKKRINVPDPGTLRKQGKEQPDTPKQQPTVSKKSPRLPTPSVTSNVRADQEDLTRPKPKSTQPEPASISIETNQPKQGSESSIANPMEPPQPKPSPGMMLSPIDHRLPPKFLAIDPEERFSTQHQGQDDHKIILPDGEGGFQRVDSRIVHVQRDGQKMQLYSAPKEKKEQKRFWQNIIAITIGIALLAIAFYLLLNW